MKCASCGSAWVAAEGDCGDCGYENSPEAVAARTRKEARRELMEELRELGIIAPSVKLPGK